MGSRNTTSSSRGRRPAPTSWGWSGTWISVEAGYFGETFGRPFDEPLPWFDKGTEPNAHMWATAEESREEIVGVYHRVERGTGHGRESLRPRSCPMLALRRRPGGWILVKSMARTDTSGT
jgi:Protein of unknown function (DUF664)